jgi:hypothetical protein
MVRLPWRLLMAAGMMTPLAVAADAVRPVTVRLDHVEWQTPVASAPVLPGRPLRIAVDDPSRRTWSFDAERGLVRSTGVRSWTWQPPATPGVVEARLEPAEGDDIDVNLLVMVPASHVGRDGRLNGYRIGSYPSTALKGNPLYLPPKGFIEVTDRTDDTHLSPRFTLGQFVSKQAQGGPRYVVIKPELIVRLEQLADRLEAQEKPEHLHVMSGYRTPFYNRAIGNVEYSLHQWGAAADVFVDGDRNGRMDDLDENGRIDKQDARTLFRIADLLEGPRPLEGGLGVYGGTAAHGPFLHIDVRDTVARW